MVDKATGRLSLVRMISRLALLLGLMFPAPAQVAIDLWTADNGLSQNIVRAICQTPDGYLWLATLDGLVRFDGVRFTTYNRGNTPGIEGNRFGSLFCTSDGDLWVGTEGSGVTRYHRGQFTSYTVQDGLPSDNTNGILGDSRGNVWVLAHGRLALWQPASSRFVPQMGEESKYTDSLTPDGRMGFWRLDSTSLHVFSSGKHNRYALPTGWRHYGASVVEDLNHHIWLANGNGKLAHLVDGAWSTTSCTLAFRDSHGNFWHSEIEWSPGTGLVRYLKLPADTQPAKIAYNTFFEDREGNIWLSTDGQGLYRIRTQTIRVLSKEQGLPDRNVYPICGGRDGSIWIGTWTGGLSRFRAGQFTTYTSAQGLASNRINAIMEDREGVLWVAVENGLHRIRNGRFEPVKAGVLSSGVTIRAIHQDPEGIMWFGTGDGLMRFDKGNWTLLTRKDGLATDDVRVLLNGRNSTLWAGGYGGLSTIQNGKVRAWTERDGLASNAIRALYEDGEGVLWIGSYDGGLTRFENGRFTRYTVREGLFSNGVFRIFEDSRGYLWMSCNQGVYRVHKKQLNDFAVGKASAITSIHYGKRDGMRNIECNGGLWPAGTRTPDGRLWFPTQDGVAVFDPDKLVASPKPPPVAIESCLLNRAPVPVDRPVRVTPRPENLEIQYTALSLIDSEHIHFRYQMQGADRDWVDAGTRRTAYYPHLQPGKYTFKVTAAHSDGVWNEAENQLAFVVLPPFYQTWWFAALLAAIAAVLLRFAYSYRLSRVEEARTAQQAFSRRLIASQENERKRIAAELHDSLGQRLVVIKNLSLLLLQDRPDIPALNQRQREKVAEISEEASGAVREVREIAYDLRPYRLDRLGLTAALQSMIETALTASSISFGIEMDNIDNVFPKADEINFYRIVQECVNNILKHSGATRAAVQIRRNGGGLTLTVRDDGKGFAHNVQAGMGGFGLMGISERAQLLGGRAGVESIPGEGTTVMIEINPEG